MKIYTLLFFILITGIIFSQNSDSAAKNHHLIIITSDPDNANVFIDDSSYGRTPLTLSSLPKSSFGLKLYDSTKHPWGYNIKLDNNEDFTIHALINKDYGLLQVYSDPSGAKIFINDSLAGVTPKGPIKINFSYTKVKIVKEGYSPFEKIIYMRPNFSYLYNLNVNLRNTIATIDLNSLGNFPSIQIDNKIVDVSAGKLSLISGEHNIQIKDANKALLFERDFEPEGGSDYSATILHKQIDYTPISFSIILPGLGQVYKGANLEGACITASFVGSIASVIISSNNYTIKNNQYNAARIQYLASTSEVTATENRQIMDDSKSILDKALLPKQLSIGMLIGIYLYNIFDVVFNHSYRDVLEFHNVTNGSKVSGNFNLSPSNLSINTRYNF